MANRFESMDAAALVEALRERTVRALPQGWWEDPDRECPECGVGAQRQKCMWDLGGSCPRNEPDAYDPSPWIQVPDPLCSAAAKLIEELADTSGEPRPEAEAS